MSKEQEILKAKIQEIQDECMIEEVGIFIMGILAQEALGLFCKAPKQTA